MNNLKDMVKLSAKATQKFGGMLKMAAFGAMTAWATGCASMSGNTQAQGPTYIDYIDPKAEDCKMKMEYYANQGKIVEATPVINPQTKQKVMVYGVREKGMWEKTKAGFAEIKDVQQGVHWGIQDTTAILDSVNGFRSVSAINRVGSSLNGVQNAINTQTTVEQQAFNALNQIFQNRSNGN